MINKVPSADLKKPYDGLQVVIRRLPPSLSKEQLEELLSPLPSYDYFEFFPADQR